MRVADEVHETEVVGSTGGDLKKCGDELAKGEGAKVGPRKELEEEVVAIGVDEGGRGEVVVVGSEVGVGDEENGEGGVV